MPRSSSHLVLNARAARGLSLGLAVLAAPLIAAPASAQQSGAPGAAPPARSAPAKPSAAKDVTTKEFVEKAAVGALFEIEAGKLAAERAQRAEVKQFAERIVKDHSAADKDMKDALAKAKAAVQPPSQLDADHRRKIETLRAAQGASFDALYVSMMKEDHEEDEDLFGAYAKSGEDPALKAFAQKVLKVIQEHAQIVAKLEKK